MNRLLLLTISIIIAPAKNLTASAAALPAPSSQESDKAVVMPNDSITKVQQLLLDVRSKSEAEKGALFVKMQQEFPH